MLPTSAAPGLARPKFAKPSSVRDLNRRLVPHRRAKIDTRLRRLTPPLCELPIELRKSDIELRKSQIESSKSAIESSKSQVRRRERDLMGCKRHVS